MINNKSLSLITHYLKATAPGGGELGYGTGFIYEKNDEYYLITNGHIVTRVNPETNKRISDSAAFPTSLSVSLRIETRENFLQVGEAQINLYDDIEDYKIPNWFVHPTHKYNVDVVAIPFSPKNKVSTNVKLYPINKIDFEERFKIEVADDVFILGYPFRLEGDNAFPIWKRGTIATEPWVDLEKLPKLLIDTATRKGMSGSPVIMSRSGLHKISEGNHISGEDFFGTIRKFVGVYSGRIGHENNYESQLGIVWKAHVIEEIIDAKFKSDVSFQDVNEYAE